MASYKINFLARLAFIVIMLMAPLLSQAATFKNILYKTYGGAGAGVSFANPDLTSPTFRAGGVPSLGYKVFLGYELTEQINLEGQWASLGSVITGADTGSRKLDYSTWAIETRFYDKPQSEHVLAIFLKAGLAKVNLKENGVALVNPDPQYVLGVGVEYPLFSTIKIRGELERHATTSTFISFSLLGRFGNASAVNAPIIEIAKNVENPDVDGDGILNTVDYCVNTPIGASADENGCASFQGIMAGIQFGAGSKYLNPSSRKTLKALLGDLAAHPEMHLEIRAYTDDRGAESTNLRLSEDRAQAVVDFLSSYGINPKNLHPVGFGEASPIASNDTVAGRKHNRRIVFYVMSTPDPL